MYPIKLCNNNNYNNNNNIYHVISYQKDILGAYTDSDDE